MIRLSLYIFIWIASMALAIFATQNISLVSIRLFNFESIKLPLGLMLVFCGGLGAVFVNFWQTSLKLGAPALPTFSGFSSVKNSSKQQQTFTAPTTKKDTPRKTQQNRDNFDDEWDEDWG